MASDQPPAGGDGPRWQDDDTESIPRVPPEETEVDAPAASPPGSTSGGAFLLGEEPQSFSEDEFSGLREQELPQGVSRRVVPLEVEPSSRVRKYIFLSEKYRGEWRRHPIQLFREGLITFAATVILGFITGYVAQRDRPELVTLALLA